MSLHSPYTTLLFAATALSFVATPLHAQITDQQLIKAFDAYTAMPDVLEPILKSVTDTQSADAAAPRLQSALEQLYDTRSALQGIKELTPQQEQLILTRYERPMREKWGRVYAEVFRLQNKKCFNSPAFTRLFRIMNLMLNK